MIFNCEKKSQFINQIVVHFRITRTKNTKVERKSFFQMIIETPKIGRDKKKSTVHYKNNIVFR